MVSGFLTAENFMKTTNKQIYKHISSFPVPKIVRESQNVDYRPVWLRLHSSVLNPEERQLMYLLIHDKLPVLERLFRISIKNDPYCSFCPDASISDREHVFCQCELTRDAWLWLRSRIVFLTSGGMTCTNIELLSLFLPRQGYHREMVWLLVNYINYVWSMVHGRETRVKVEKLYGFLKWKYKQESNFLDIAILERCLQ